MNSYTSLKTSMNITCHEKPFLASLVAFAVSVSPLLPQHAWTVLLSLHESLARCLSALSVSGLPDSSTGSWARPPTPSPALPLAGSETLGKLFQGPGPPLDVGMMTGPSSERSRWDSVKSQIQSTEDDAWHRECRANVSCCCVSGSGGVPAANWLLEPSTGLSPGRSPVRACCVETKTLKTLPLLPENPCPRFPSIHAFPILRLLCSRLCSRYRDTAVNNARTSIHNELILQCYE